MEVERGAVICCSNKKCTLGPMSKGTRNRVMINLKCPKGTRSVGTWHTHPGGHSYPSPTDVRNLQKAGLNMSCVTGGQGLKCYRIGNLK
jgi:hypothetical protein